MINSYFKSAIFFVTFLSISFSTVGGTIALQGILRDPNGTTVTDGSYSLTIKLYEDVTGGTPVFTEVIGSAAVQNGVFSIEIGATSASSSDLDQVPFNTTYYVGVTVESGTEMTPRTKLTVSPYSMAMYGSSNIIPNTGNVGLGTLSPQAVVHIKDVENNSGEDLLLIEDNSGGDQIRVEDDGTLTLPTIGSKVGIGTATPSAMLDISSAGSSDDFVVIKDGSNNQKFVVESDGTLTLPTVGSKVGIGTATPSAMLDISSAGSSDDFVVIKDGSNNQKFVVESDGSLIIPDGGSVGVGTSAPAAALDIKASSNQDVLSIKTSDGTEVFDVDATGDMTLNDDLVLGSGGTITFADGSALVSPYSSLASLGISTNNDAIINADTDGNGSGDITMKIDETTMISVSNSGATTINTNLDVSGSSTLRNVSSSGLTVTGTTLLSALNTSGNVDVTGNITVSGNVDGRDISADGTKLDGIAAGATNVTNNNQITNGRGYITSTVGSTPSFNTVTYNNPINGFFRVGVAYHINGNNDGGTNSQLQWWYDDPEGPGYNHVGSLLGGNGGQGWYNASDRNLKQNIQDYPSSLEKVLDLRPVTYNWKTHPDEDPLAGFIAQNVKELFPQLTADIDWREGGTRLGVNYSLLVVPAIKAIQEQQDIIDQQGKDIKALIKRIELLEANQKNK